jgi:hypothetical protein
VEPRRKETNVYFTAIGAAVLGALIVFAAVGHAQSVEAVIHKVDPENNVLTIEPIGKDAERLPKPLDVTVTRDADLEGIVSLEELKEGNQVTVEVKENKDLQVWEAKKVELKSSGEES